MIRINLLTDDVDRLRRAYYRWYTIKVDRHCVKLGPVTVLWYRWFDERLRISLCCLGSREIILFGGRLV